MYRARVKEPPGPHDPSGRAISSLVIACPSFADPLAEHRAAWPDVDGPHAYIDMGRFATHLVGLLDTGEVAEFTGVFAVVEALLADEDPGVRYLVKVGLLEDVGNVASTHGWPWAARFRAWFGPLATEAWDDLHQMWGTRDPGSTRGG